MSDGAAQEGDHGRCPLVGEHLGVGEPGGVVDGHVHVLPARSLRLPATRAGDAMAGTVDPDELLDVDVHELARARLLVPVGLLGRLERGQSAEADASEDR